MYLNEVPGALIATFCAKVLFLKLFIEMKLLYVLGWILLFRMFANNFYVMVLFFVLLSFKCGYVSEKKKN